MSAPRPTTVTEYTRATRESKIVAKLSIQIDPGQAHRSAQIIRRDLREIGDQAQKTERRTHRLGQTANENFRDMAKNTGLVTRGFAGMARAAAGALSAIAGLAGATFSLRKFIQNTNTAQAAQAQLAAAIASTGGSAGQSLADLNAHAAALQKMTTFGDETINTMQGVLLTFTNVRGGVFRQATEAILDVSTAMNQDLKSAAIQVGKALNDPATQLTALSRSGITFSDVQEEVIKGLAETGQVAQAQILILKELQRQFGGSAQAARRVLGGALDALSNSWNDQFELSESATESLRQAVENLVKTIESPEFTTFIQAIGNALVGAFRLAVGGASFLIKHIETVGKVATVAGAGLLASMGPSIMASMIAGFVALARGAIAAMNAIRLAFVTNPIGTLVTALVVAGTAAYVFRDQIKDAVGVDIIGTIKDVANKIVGSFVGAYQSIIAVWSQLPSALGDLAFQAANSVIDAIESMINGAIARINTLISSLQNLPFVGDNFKGAGIGDVDLGGVGNPFAGSAASVGQTIGQTFSRTLNTDYIGRLGDLISGTKSATEATRTMNGAIRAAEEEAGRLGETATGSAGKAKDAWKGLRNSVDEVNEGMQSIGDTASGFFKDFFGGIRSGESAWESFARAGQNAISRITDSIIDSIFSINGAGGGGGGFLSQIFGGLFGGGSQLAIAQSGAAGLFAKGSAFRGGNIIPFARGGVVNGPTLFPMAKGVGLMGEAGPEAVMPLHRGPDGSLGVRAANQNRQNGQRNLTIVVNVDGGSGDQHVKDLAREAVFEGLAEYDRGNHERVAAGHAEARSRGMIKR